MRDRLDRHGMQTAMQTHHAGPRAGTPDPTIDSSRHIALYLQLASIFRHKIVSNAWPEGYQLPNLDMLAAEFRVARVTVRQAVALLVKEQLLTSSRGRGTFVLPPTAQRAGPAPIDPMGEASGKHRIVIQSTSETPHLPADFRGTCGVYDRYTAIEKVHLQDDQPFATMQIYVPTEIYTRLPKRRLDKQKILTLILDTVDVAGTLEQIMTVEPADHLLARRLDYPFGSPVARIMRRVVDQEHRLVYAGASWYRGDRFVMSMTLPTSVVQEMPPEVFAPQSRTR